MKQIYARAFLLTILLAVVSIIRAQTTTCASSYILLSTDPASCAASPTGNCTGSNAANFFRARIRIYFAATIPIGTSTPVITSALSGVTNLMSDYQFCLSGDQGTAVARTYADYCVYGKNNSGPFPTGALSLTLQSTGLLVSPLCNVLNNIPCPTTVICLSDQTNCTPCDPTFPFLTGKIRVFFPSSIPAGVPNPAVTAVLDAGITLNQFRLCAAANAATNVERNFVDYCVYSNQSGQTLPTSALSLTLQLGSLPTITCLVSLSSIPCPSAFASVSNTTACTPCDPNYTILSGKVRLFFPTPIQAGIPNPVINAVANGSTTLNQFRLCASSTANTNVERNFIDYCVYTNLAGQILPNLPLTFTTQLSSCSAPMVCLVHPTSELPCVTGSTAINTTTGPGGAGGIEAGCVNQTTCSGLIVFFASKLRVNFSPCLPAGFPAPTVSSFTRTLADGTVIRYCLDVSASSAAQINQQRCFIDYCVYSTLSGDTFLGTNPPNNLNLTYTVMINGNNTPLTQGACQAGIPLPVKFNSFTATRNGAQVSLRWSTASETNNTGFNIQRNTGTGWENIGFVNTQAINGNSSASLNYLFTDNNTIRVITQYRIQQVDLDSRTSLSEIRSVQGVGSNGTLVYENPSFDGNLEILFNDATTTRDVAVVDMAGRLIRQIRNVTNNHLRIDHLNRGVYTLRIVDTKTGQKEYHKIIVENP